MTTTAMMAASAPLDIDHAPAEEPEAPASLSAPPEEEEEAAPSPGASEGSEAGAVGYEAEVVVGEGWENNDDDEERCAMLVEERAADVEVDASSAADTIAWCVVCSVG
ncbi:hypothetical protein H2203_008002 [Taxawa tesnikishii (nom. ined.)]|nr:hypothetical protein H2203_008002 [Dothideales sp. JES 119]